MSANGHITLSRMTKVVRRLRLPCAALLLFSYSCELNTLTCASSVLTPGQLAITEISLSEEPWIEVYNPTESDVPIYGLSLFQKKRNGTKQNRILFRGEEVVLAHEYKLLQPSRDEWKPHARGLVQIESCESIIDTVIYSTSSRTEPLQYGGIPSAEDNDNESRWCNRPATPGFENSPC